MSDKDIEQQIHEVAPKNVLARDIDRIIKVEQFKLSELTLIKNHLKDGGKLNVGAGCSSIIEIEPTPAIIDSIQKAIDDKQAELKLLNEASLAAQQAINSVMLVNNISS